MGRDLVFREHILVINEFWQSYANELLMFVRLSVLAPKVKNTHPSVSNELSFNVSITIPIYVQFKVMVPHGSLFR